MTDSGGESRPEPTRRGRRRALVTAAIFMVSATLTSCGGGRSATGAALGTTSTESSVPPGSVLPTVDPFYRWNGSLVRYAPGAVLRVRPVDVTRVGQPTPAKVTQLLYVTTDELGRRAVSVATVVQPDNGAESAATRLVSYQEAYDALGAQCDPSYIFPLTMQHETVPAPIPLQYAAAGYTVVMSDYEGEDLAYGAGQQSGYETLDAIRAAERWLGAPEHSTPVGLIGYSGGSIATEFASELAPAYAPDLDIVGVAEGGIPVDLFHNIAYVDQPGSIWTWTIPALMVGLARGFDLRDLDRYLTPRGIAVVKSDASQCAGDFTGLTIEQMFKPQFRNIEKVPLFVRILDRLIMTRTGTPRAPLLIGVGQSDSVGDGVMVTKDVEQLADTYCQRGTPVQFHVYQGLSHTQAGLPFLEEAQAFLVQRFEDVPFQNGCPGVVPGDPITPVSIPGS
ncbi:MAG TPA: lipase family protein [Acidimicrobiales bacterium]|nr:lipase family protein [Acidimicrobiales bacterium]